jgi:hypothetical protein
VARLGPGVGAGLLVLGDSARRRRSNGAATGRGASRAVRAGRGPAGNPLRAKTAPGGPAGRPVPGSAQQAHQVSVRRTNGSPRARSRVRLRLPHGAVAQLGERVTGSHEVRGSIPLGSTVALVGGSGPHRVGFRSRNRGRCWLCPVERPHTVRLDAPDAGRLVPQDSHRRRKPCGRRCWESCGVGAVRVMSVGAGLGRFHVGLQSHILLRATPSGAPRQRAHRSSARRTCGSATWSGPTGTRWTLPHYRTRERSGTGGEREKRRTKV